MNAIDTLLHDLEKTGGLTDVVVLLVCLTLAFGLFRAVAEAAKGL